MSYIYKSLIDFSDAIKPFVSDVCTDVLGNIIAQKMMQGYDPLNGKTLRERLAELPDYVPMKIQREMSPIDYSDTRISIND